MVKDVKTTKKKTQRKDKLKSKAKVIKSRLKDPLKTTREVKAETGMSHMTVARRDKELLQSVTKDDRIIWICEEDIEIVKLAQAKMKNIIKNMDTSKETEKVKARDLSAIAKESSARYSIFMGDRTDDKGWEKIISINDLYDKEE